MSVTVLLPLVVLLLGLWEAERGRADLSELEAGQHQLTRILAALETRAPRDGRFDMGLQFRWGGQSYAGPLALEKAREALDDVDMAVTVAQARRLCSRRS